MGCGYAVAGVSTGVHESQSHRLDFREHGVQYPPHIVGAVSRRRIDNQRGDDRR